MTTVAASLLEKLDQGKARLRKELAALPIEEKLRILLLMQRQENAARRQRGLEARPEWPLP